MQTPTQKRTAQIKDDNPKAGTMRNTDRWNENQQESKTGAEGLKTDAKGNIVLERFTSCNLPEPQTKQGLNDPKAQISGGIPRAKSK